MFKITSKICADVKSFKKKPKKQQHTINQANVTSKKWFLFDSSVGSSRYHQG